ncbi:hypothetical protein PAMP_006478 [Pampus punctatissimus]
MDEEETKKGGKTSQAIGQSISPTPPISFRDSFTLWISRAGDRASNPFPDAFLIVWESRGGWDRTGLTTYVSYVSVKLTWCNIVLIKLIAEVWEHCIITLKKTYIPEVSQVHLLD